MKKIQIIAILILVISLVSCKKFYSHDIEIFTDVQFKTKRHELVQKIYETDNDKKYTNNDIKRAKKLDQKGSQLNKQKKFKAAIKAFYESLKVFPTAGTYFNLGNSYLNDKQYKKAVYANMLAIKYMPKHRLYHYNLACAYSLLKDVKFIPHALKHLERALDLGYNAFDHIFKDPDLEPIWKWSDYKPTFIRLLNKYRKIKITDDLILKEGYCEMDFGFMTRRFIFNKDKTFTVIDSAPKKYHVFHNNPKKNIGTWKIDNGILLISAYKYIYSRTSGHLYIKYGSHTCSF